MKNFFTLFLILLFSSTYAQIAPNAASHGSNQAIISDEVTMSGDEALRHLIANPNPTTVALRMASSPIETMIGNTTYDLQSNGSVMDRIIKHSNGISAAWTMSQQYSSSYTDRGTGYAYHDGSSWVTSMPQTALESSRCGWPSMLTTSTGKEMVVAHNTANSYFQMTHRPTLGTGIWTEQIVSSQDSLTGLYRDLVWNRTAVGGINE